MTTETFVQMMLRGDMKRLDDLLGRRAGTSGGRTLTPILQELPPLSDDDVDGWLEACRRQSRYDLLILSAVRYGRVQPVMSIRNPKLHPVLRHLLQGELLVELAAQGLWPCWNGLLSGHTRQQATILLLWLASRPINSPALEAFKMLVGRFLYDRRLLKVVLDETLTGGTSQYEFLLYSDNDIIQRLLRDGSEHTAHLARLLSHRCHFKTLSNTRLDYDAYVQGHDARLSLACQAGLFSAPPPTARVAGCTDGNWRHYAFVIFMLAVNSNRPDLVQFIYSTRAVSVDNVRKALAALRRRQEGDQEGDLEGDLEGDQEGDQEGDERELRQRCEDVVMTANSGDSLLEERKRAEQEIHDFLVEKASPQTVRPIEDAWLASVSEALGWGRRRRSDVENVEIIARVGNAFVEMELPASVKRQLLTNCDMTLLGKDPFRKF